MLSFFAYFELYKNLCLKIDAVKRAVFVDQSIDHMSGGISREKRSVDYDKVVVQ